MLLTAEKSECEKNQKIIVSRDKGSSCQHRAINDKGESDVRQYQLDGKLVVDETCCDYLVLNDSAKSAYLEPRIPEDFLKYYKKVTFFVKST